MTKAQLDAILDHLSVDASNPVAVMTQDVSRTFLGGATTDQKKYDLYMSATLLADISDSLNAAYTMVDQTKVSSASRTPPL